MRSFLLFIQREHQMFLSCTVMRLCKNAFQSFLDQSPGSLFHPSPSLTPRSSLYKCLSLYALSRGLVICPPSECVPGFFVLLFFCQALLLSLARWEKCHPSALSPESPPNKHLIVHKPKRGNVFPLPPCLLLPLPPPPPASSSPRLLFTPARPRP